jgi:predicted enzyme related to lactoylglutathione lyase
VHTESDWVRFRLEGGELALHLNPQLEKAKAAEPMRFGAVVSFDVENIDAALRRATQAGFTLAGEVHAEPYGKQAEVRDPWGNRLSFVERHARDTK